MERQSARSIHFLTMCSFLAFLVVHVTLVVMTGFARNMNHIVMGTDATTQFALRFVTYPMQLITLNRLNPHQDYPERDISPHFWPSGKMPIRDDWKRLAAQDFREYKLKIGGLVENRAELSLSDLHGLPTVEHITMHHCIQGWTGIAKWGGVPIRELMRLVRPLPEARVAAFFSFGEALYGEHLRSRRRTPIRADKFFINVQSR